MDLEDDMQCRFHNKVHLLLNRPLTNYTSQDYMNFLSCVLRHGVLAQLQIMYLKISLRKIGPRVSKLSKRPVIIPNR